MKSIVAGMAVATTLALGACATPADNLVVDASGRQVPAGMVDAYTTFPDGVAGSTYRIQTQSGVVNMVNFAPNGVMTIQPDPNGPVVQGTYGLRGQNMCINFVPRGEECWPNQSAMMADQPMTVTSNRGQTLTITKVPMAR